MEAMHKAKAGIMKGLGIVIIAPVSYTHLTLPTT